jgi:hypothetical protein
MWSEIHNRFLKLSDNLEAEKLRSMVKREFNYENLYEDVLRSSEFSEDEKNLFFKAVLGAYEALDDVIREFRQAFYSSDILDLNRIRDFFERLSGKPKERGFLFTLNQDIFIERYCYGGNIGPSLPGLQVENKRFVSKESRPLQEIGYVKIAQNDNAGYQKVDFKNQSKLFYVKLHGSYDWRDDDNQEILIIGTNKPSRISSNPMSLPNMKLMVIGYGFRDKHINEAIAKAAKESNLKIYILNPQDPETFLFKTLGINQWASEAIWKAVRGYFQITPKEMFLRNPIHTSVVNDLYKTFFD